MQMRGNVFVIKFKYILLMKSKVKLAFCVICYFLLTKATYAQSNVSNSYSDSLPEDSLPLSSRGVPFGLWNSSASFIHYYPFYNGVQMIEIESTLYNIWDMDYGPPRDMYIRSRYTPLGNPIILRNERGKILSTYNLYEGQLGGKYKLLSPKKSLAVIETHKQVNALQRNLKYRYKDRGITESPVNNYIIRNKEDKHGVIDTLGKEMLKVDFENIVFRNNSYYVEQNRVWGLYDSSFKLTIPIKYKKLKYFKKNYHCACLPLCGVITTNEDTIVPFKYFDISQQKYFYFFSEKIAKDSLIQSSYEYIKYGIMDEAFNIITPATYVDVKPWLTDIYGDEPINKKYLNTIIYWAAKQKSLNKNMLYGGLDVYGKEITKFKYGPTPPKQLSQKMKYYGVALQQEDIMNRDDYKKEKEVLLDSSFEQVGKVYDKVLGYFDENGFIYVEKGGKKGVINNKGELIVPIVYDDIGLFDGDVTPVAILVNNKKKWGIVNTKGELVVECKYESISHFKYEAVAVSQDVNGKIKYGVISKKGEVIVPFEYDRIDAYKDAKYFFAINYNNPGKRDEFKFIIENINGKYQVNFVK